MPAYSGKFQYIDAAGAVSSQGPCQFRFDQQTAIVTPQSGTPIAFDLGDVDRAVKHDWDFELALFTGRRVQLQQFGAPFSTMCEELLAAWRERTVHCLLLEDLEQVARVHRNCGADRPAGARRDSPVQEQHRSAAARWAGDSVAAGGSRTSLVRRSRIRRHSGICRRSAGDRQAGQEDRRIPRESRRRDRRIAHARRRRRCIPPSLSSIPINCSASVETLPEGRSVPLAVVAGDPPETARRADRAALSMIRCGPTLTPYAHVPRPIRLMTGFKFIRPDEDKSPPEGEAGPEEKQPLFFWFFFPLASGRVAWESTSGSGRATYFFDGAAPPEQAIARLTRGLALVNFRREPVYLPDESLEQQPQFRRYAIACRKLPDLRTLRSAFRGRAIHTSLEAWTAQVDAAEADGR